MDRPSTKWPSKDPGGFSCTLPLTKAAGRTGLVPVTDRKDGHFLTTKGTQAMNIMKKHFKPKHLVLFVPMIIAYLIEMI